MISPPENPEKCRKARASFRPNVWTKMNPPKLPKLNRDWGSAVLDPDRDLILRWSGRPCAHGGSDVIQYHPGHEPLGALLSRRISVGPAL